VRAGDLIKIKGGEKIPVDGIIESGESTVSEAILTGESEPIHKRKGDSMLAGSTNGDGLLFVRTERVGTETMLMRVAGNVKQIQESKPLLLTIFDKVIDRYVMAVLALALSTAAGWAIYKHVVHDCICLVSCSCNRLSLCDRIEHPTCETTCYIYWSRQRSADK
jgi:P-type E1-E2 ATPase